jgi:hypothetical protein
MMESMKPRAGWSLGDHKLRIWMQCFDDDEARTELYLTYSEGVLELTAKQCAKNNRRAISLAAWQAGVVRRLWRG